MASPNYPLNALRAVALHTQGLAAPNGGETAATPGAITATVERLGWVQIDTLHVVARSQYLTLWSRFGSYDPADFDRRLFDPGERELFEYWGHAASIIPLKHYRYSLPSMRQARENPGRWWDKWLTETTNREVVEHVRERIQAEGALKVSDFEHEPHRNGGWWDWKPAKRALEYLFTTGELMIADRVNFQRVYDQTERVLPDWVDTSEPTADEADRFTVELAVRALGVCRPAQAAEYAYMKRGSATPIVERLTREGVFVEVKGTLHDGSTAELIAHRDNLPLLDRAADGALSAARTTFLSPFDSLFWARGRDEDLWGFRQVLEAYKREPDRIWGYFCLPILHNDRLVGRFDPKVERRDGLLRLKALYLELGVEVTDELVGGVAAAMRDFMAFHGATELVVERSDAGAFGERLSKAL